MSEPKHRQPKLIPLMMHTITVYPSDLYIHQDSFPDLKSGDFVRVTQQDDKKESSVEVILRVPPSSLVYPQQTANAQLSLSKRISTALEFVQRRPVTVEKVLDVSEIIVDEAVFTFKDIYLGREDMYHIKLSLEKEVIFASMKLSFGMIDLTVQELKNTANKSLKSGLITSQTKLVFRSRSAKFFIFLQMSREMWEFAEDSNLYFERVISNYLPQLFTRWKKAKTAHSVSIIFFSRMFYTKAEVELLTQQANENKTELPIGVYKDKYYRDFYKVIVDNETRSDWFSVLKDLKREFITYPDILGWKHPLRGTTDRVCIGENSPSSQGNFLEAIYLALEEFDKHQLDRDLKHTGQGIIILAPGGYFEVDKHLADVTKQRAIDTGIGCDLVCISKPPLHVVPLFRYITPTEKRKTQRASGLYSKPTKETGVLAHMEHQQVYKFPFWVYVSFFVPTARKHDNIIYGLMELIYGNNNLHNLNTQVTDDSIVVPLSGCRGVVNQWLSEELMQSPLQTLGEFDSVNTTTEYRLGFQFTPKASPYVTPTLAIRGTKTDSLPASHSHFSAGSVGSMPDSPFGSFLLLDSFPVQPLVKPHCNEIVNPFDLSAIAPQSSSTRRWSHLYPRVQVPLQRNITAPSLFTSPENWRSQTEPACLPLGTSYVPTNSEFNRHYSQGAYTLSLPLGDDIYQHKTEDLLKELVSQRVAQNFQLVDTEQTSGRGITKYLALGHIYHAIIFDETAQNITVIRYHLTHKLHQQSQVPIPYKYALWPANSNQFVSAEIKIRYTTELQTNWNAVDQLICGESDVSEVNLASVRTWQIQFVILPNEELLPPTGNEPTLAEAKLYEEKQVQAFIAFKKNLLKNNRIFKKELSLDVEIINEYSDQPEAHIVEEVQADTNLPNQNEPKESVSKKLQSLVVAMRLPNSGLEIRNRKCKSGTVHRRCFVARELVDWILRNVELQTYNRESGLELARQLEQFGFVNPVSGAEPFQDSEDFYRFSEDQTLVDIRNASILQKKQKPYQSESQREPHKLSFKMKSQPDLTVTGSPKDETPSQKLYHQKNAKKTVRMELVVSTSKSADRYQWAVLQYDSVYYPNCCYHLEIQWMICAGSVIKEIVSHMERQAKLCGVTMVQVPVQRDLKDRAFRAPIHISVPLEVDKHSLLHRFGFMIDNKFGSHVEYMHRTGVAFMQLVENGFVWTYNYTPTLQHQMSTASALLKEIQDVCADLVSCDDEDLQALFAE